MKSNRSQSLGLRILMLSAWLLVLGSAAFAHESRLVGPNGEYRVVVGWRNEPAFEDAHNAADITITRASDSRPINNRAGDVVDLTVEVQLRATDAFNAPIRDSAVLVDPLRLVFGTTNRYNSWFRPSRDGAFALRFQGVIHDASNPVAGPVTIDETFVCGGGSQSATGAFNCILDPQVFPSKGPKDHEGYRDDD